MKKSEFRKLLHGEKFSPRKNEVVTLDSVTDPSFAQSVRENLANPLPYEPKKIYSNGVALQDMQPFDGMYVDKHIAFQAAKELDSAEHAKVKDWKKSQETKENEIAD